MQENRIKLDQSAGSLGNFSLVLVLMYLCPDDSKANCKISQIRLKSIKGKNSADLQNVQLHTFLESEFQLESRKKSSDMNDTFARPF